MFDKSKNLSIELSLRWKCAHASYVDRHFLVKTNFWRDFYPPRMDYQIKRAAMGETITIDYKPGEILPEEFCSSNLKSIPKSKFNRTANGPIPILPATGRFYPRGLIDGVAGCFKEDVRPFRILNQTDQQLDIDLNHPLASFPLQLSATIVDAYEAAQQHGGRCNDIAELMSISGPGMQCLIADPGSDYFSAMPFIRQLEDADENFYAPLKTADSVDLNALKELQEFYLLYLNAQMQVLDLMAGASSRVGNGIELDITGLGLKEKELSSNTDLSAYHLHDLNSNPALPFKAQQFDAVICSFGIEYITHPFKIFSEVARILKPGGIFLIGFSDRFYPQKVISIWDDVHSFERMGIVLEYFRQSGQFEKLHCESIRGKLRRDDDPFVAKNVYSCPMFMLKGSKKL